MDRLNAEQRSENMRRIGPKNTAPEIVVRKLLHSMGFRFRLHRRDLPGVPDVTISGKNTVIFVHGCFWHRHPGCQFAYTPKTRTDFWIAKLDGNRQRDDSTKQSLEALGWKVITIWECEIKDKENLRLKLLTFLSSAKELHAS